MKRMRSSDKNDKPELIRGLNDLRDYRLIRLQNGIEAMLVKIPEGQSSKASVSVAVNAGSMHEPESFGGLAHFVEHCIFLGNKKYPTRNSLDRLLSKHNGYSNAHTELEYTAFYLEVNREGLSKAVEIFASAFEEPSFDKDMCCAELEAVDSEFHEILNNDDCRVEQMLCHMSTASHPYRRFTWGNRASLLKHGEEKLVTAAQTFFDTHYCASRTKICIVSSYSFGKMEMLASQFGRIPHRVASDSVPLTPLKDMGFPIPATSLPLTVAVQPVAEVHQLILLFQLPSIFIHYRSKPVDYLAHMIGHEAQGSLIYALRESNLAVDLSAGVGSDGYSCNGGLSLFEVKLNLTTQGVRQWRRVVHEFVFPYIEEIRNKGVVPAVYEEMRKVGLFQFHQTSEESTKDPIDTAEELAIQMLDSFEVDRSHLLIYDYLFEGFERDLISTFLKALTKEAAFVVLVTPGEYSQIEPTFGIKYEVLDDAIFEKSNESSPEYIVPPPSNYFVPENPLDVQPVLATQCGDVITEPTDIVEVPSSNLRMFLFKHVRSQISPKVDIRIRLNLQGFEVSDFVCTHLYVAYLTDFLESKLYNAKLVGFSVSIAAVTAVPGYPNTCGIEISVNGFAGKIGDVLELILTQLKVSGQILELDSARLARITEVLRRGFSNEELHPVSTQALNIRKTALAPMSFYRASAKLDALAGVTLTTFVCAGADANVVGSFDDALVARIRDMVVETIGAVSSKPEGTTDILAVNKISQEFVITESALNPDEPTSCLVMYYQLSSEYSVETSAVADVLSDLMSEPFFDTLRTEEQLGYSLRCGSRYTNGSIGMEFMIQSSCESPEHLVSRVESFISDFYQKELDEMSDDEFNDQIASLIEGLVETPNSLAAEAKDLWNEVTEGRYQWTFNREIKAEIERAFTNQKSKMRDLVEDLLMNSKRRIVVHVNGGGKKSN